MTTERPNLKPGDSFIYTNEAGVWIIGTVHRVDENQIMTGWVQKSSLREPPDINELYPNEEIKIPLSTSGLARLPDPQHFNDGKLPLDLP